MKLFIILLTVCFSINVHANVCDRTAQVVDALVEATNKKCDQITSQDLSNIKYLNFEYADPMPFPKAGDFSGLVNLKALELPEIGLKELPDGIFSDLKSLQLLDLNTNRLQKLPTEIKQLKNLLVLNISSNRIVELPSDFFAGLTNLESLDTSYNSWASSFDPSIFNGSKKINTILADGLEIAKVDLSKLSNLSFMYLTLKNTTTLPNLGFLPKLNELILGDTDNHVTFIDQNYLAGCNKLQYLQINNTDIVEYPSELLNGLTDLKIIRLFGNNPAYIPPSLFKGLSNLKKLELNATDLSENSFLETKSLKELLIYIQSPLSQNIFSGLSNLKRLEIQSTGLAGGLFDTITNVETIMIYANHNGPIPENLFVNLNNLKVLNVGNGYIVNNPFIMELTPEVFNGEFSKLTHLMVAQAKLSQVPYGFFQKLKNIESISIISGLESLPDSAFSGLQNLNWITLINNKLETVPSDAFLNTPSLKFLDLRGNNLNEAEKNAVKLSVPAKVEVRL